MKNKTLIAIALVGLFPFTALASGNEKSDAHQEKHFQHHHDIEMIEVGFTLSKNSKELTNTQTAFPLIFNNKKYGKDKRDNVVDTKIGKIYFSHKINPLLTDDKEKEAFSTKVSHNKDKNEFVFDISENEKPVYQTSVPYQKGKKTVKNLGEYKLVVEF